MPQCACIDRCTCRCHPESKLATRGGSVPLQMGYAPTYTTTQRAAFQIPRAADTRGDVRAMKEQTRATNWNFGSEPFQNESTHSTDFRDPGPVGFTKHTRSENVSSRAFHGPADWSTTHGLSYTAPPADTKPRRPLQEGRELRATHYTLGDQYAMDSTTHDNDFRHPGVQPRTQPIKPRRQDFPSVVTKLGSSASHWQSQANATYQTHSDCMCEPAQMRLRESHFSLGTAAPRFQTTHRTDFVKPEHTHDCCKCVR